MQIFYSPQVCPLFVHYCSQKTLKITLSHYKSIKDLWLYSVKYGILPQIAKTNKIFSLSDRDKSLLGHYYGAFGYEKMKIEDIATLEIMTENGVKKAKDKAIKHFWELFPKSNFSTWIGVFHRVRMQIKYPDIEY